MSSGEVRKVSSREIQLMKVQNLIGQCLQLYMSQKEVVTLLLVQEKIEPAFTEHVWAKLEERHPEFFKAYHLRLLLKEQIREFNNLLARHVELKHQVGQPGGGGGSCFLPVISNGSAHIPSRGGVSPNFGMTQGRGVDGGGNVKTESGCYIFGGDDNNNNVRTDGGGGGGSSCFSSAEPTSTLLDADSSSFGYFGQISPNFALSDLTADFSNSFDIVESYSGSPFLATGSENFLDSHVSGDHPGEYKRLNGQSEGLGYEDFGSD